MDQVCPKRVLPVGNEKIAFLHASMGVTSYSEFFRMGSDRDNGILMSLLLLVAEANKLKFEVLFSKFCGLMLEYIDKRRLTVVKFF